MTLTAQKGTEMALSLEQLAGIKHALARKGHSETDIAQIVQSHTASLRSEINPTARKFGMAVANVLFGFGFTKVNVEGLEGTLYALNQGGFSVVSTHLSYADIPILANLTGTTDTFIIGGNNVYNVPVIKPFLEKFFRNAGMIPIRRDIIDQAAEIDTAEAYAYGIILTNTVAGHLNSGSNVINFHGTGRYRSGAIPEGNYLLTRALVQGSRGIVTASITYDKPPEARPFASGQSRRNAIALTGAWQITKAKLTGDSGEAYVVFGEPIAIEHPGMDKAAAKRQIVHTQEAIYESLARNMTLTPTNTVAAALLRHPTTDWFSLLTHSLSIIDQAQDAGARLAQALVGQERADHLREAFEYFERRKAVKGPYAFEITDQRLLNYYAATINPTLDRLLQPSART